MGTARFWLSLGCADRRSLLEQYVQDSSETVDIGSAVYIEDVHKIDNGAFAQHVGKYYPRQVERRKIYVPTNMELDPYFGAHGYYQFMRIGEHPTPVHKANYYAAIGRIGLHKFLFYNSAVYEDVSENVACIHKNSLATLQEADLILMSIEDNLILDYDAYYKLLGEVADRTWREMIADQRANTIRSYNSWRGPNNGH